jgi:hypothetical protein
MPRLRTENKRRADIGRDYVEDYGINHGEMYKTRTRSESKSLAEQNASDLIADLMWFCYSKGIDFFALTDRARGHFNAELMGD